MNKEPYLRLNIYNFINDQKLNPLTANPAAYF